jgi:hypothetical protein
LWLDSHSKKIKIAHSFYYWFILHLPTWFFFWSKQRIRFSFLLNHKTMYERNCSIVCLPAFESASMEAIWPNSFVPQAYMHNFKHNGHSISRAPNQEPIRPSESLGGLLDNNKKNENTGTSLEKFSVKFPFFYFLNYKLRIIDQQQNGTFRRLCGHDYKSHFICCYFSSRFDRVPLLHSKTFLISYILYIHILKCFTAINF